MPDTTDIFCKELRELYNRLSDNEKEQLTDASGIYIKNKLPVGIVQGGNV